MNGAHSLRYVQPVRVCTASTSYLFQPYISDVIRNITGADNATLQMWCKNPEMFSEFMSSLAGHERVVGVRLSGTAEERNGKRRKYDPYHVLVWARADNMMNPARGSVPPMQHRARNMRPEERDALIQELL